MFYVLLLFKSVHTKESLNLSGRLSWLNIFTSIILKVSVCVLVRVYEEVVEGVCTCLCACAIEQQD